MRGILISPWEEFANAPELVAFLVNPVNRLSYVYERLAVCAEASNWKLPAKPLKAASRLLHGDSGWDHWLRRRLMGEPSKYEPNYIARMEALPMQMIGYVYFAKSPLRPSNIKIGFTTRIPEVRVKSLMANSGERLTLIGAFAGTYMDEQILHCINSKEQVAGEWYCDPHWLPDVPFLREVEMAA